MPYHPQVRAALAFLEPICREDHTGLKTQMDAWQNDLKFSHAVRVKGEEAIKKLSKIVAATLVRKTLLNISKTGITTPDKGMYRACIIALPNRRRPLDTLSNQELNTAHDRILYAQIAEPIYRLFNVPTPLTNPALNDVAKGLYHIVTDLKEFPNHIRPLSEIERNRLK